MTLLRILLYFLDTTRFEYRSIKIELSKNRTFPEVSCNAKARGISTNIKVRRIAYHAVYRQAVEYPFYSVSRGFIIGPMLLPLSPSMSRCHLELQHCMQIDDKITRVGRTDVTVYLEK